MRRSKFLPPKTDEQLRAERKARRQRRELWKKDPDQARKIEDEEMKAQWAKNDKLITEHKAKKAEIMSRLSKYISFSRFNCPDKYHPTAQGGKLVCKLCGKEYSWTEWGRVKTLACHRMADHLVDYYSPLEKSRFRGHEIKDIGSCPRFEISDWVEAEDKRLYKDD